MPCYHTIKGFRAPGGQIKFSRSGAYKDLPITIACGQCWGCKIDRSIDWSTRCVHEAKSHEKNSYITLTYNDEHLPTDLSLNLEHWQKFAKRLRKKCGPFRFMHCGEYGDKNLRPHYHAIIFGLDFAEDRIPQTMIRGNILYKSPTLEKVWGKGWCSIGELTRESAAYVARYSLKKITGEIAEKHYNGRKPEYITMSRRPGLGSEWINKWKTDVYPSDEIIIDGRPTKPPKFYDKEITKTNEKLMKKVKAIRKKNSKEYNDKNPKEQLAYRLHAKEIVKKAKYAQQKRDI